MGSLARMLLTLFALSAFHESHAQHNEEGPREGNAEATSVFQAFSANWLALEFQDVLVESESFFVGSSGETENRNSRYRLVADYPNNRFFFVVDGQLEQSVLEESTKSRALNALFLDATRGEAWFRFATASEPRRFPLGGPPSDVRGYLASSGFHDLRLIGTRQFPTRFWKDVSIKEFFARAFSPSISMSTRDLGEGKLEVVKDEKISENASYERRYVFDVERLVPLTLVESQVSKNGRRRRHLTESIEWEERNGVFVPTKLVGEVLVISGRDPATRAPMYVPKYYEASFQWRVVNEKDRLPDIQPQMLASVAQLNEFLSAPESEDSK